MQKAVFFMFCKNVNLPSLPAKTLWRTIFVLAIFICNSDVYAQTVTAATNGLNKPNDNTVGLGGTLTNNTVIDLGASYNFGINKGNAGYLSILNNGKIRLGVNHYLLLSPEENAFRLHSINYTDATNHALIQSQFTDNIPSLDLSAQTIGSIVKTQNIHISPYGIQFGGYKNNATNDSVLTTDANGNLKLVSAVFKSFGGTYYNPREVKFYSPSMYVQGKMGFNNNVLYLQGVDTSEAPYDGTTGLRLYPGYDERYFVLESNNGSYKSIITGMGSDAQNGQFLKMDVSNDVKSNTLNLYPEGITVTSLKNTGDQLLTTDANGSFKLVPKPAAGGGNLQDSSWYHDGVNIYNKNSGNVGIGTNTPTAKLHTLGSVRFESYKNSQQGDSVLTTDVNGNLKLIYMPYGSGGGGGGTYNFQNGIVQSNGNVTLGGQLQDSVKINLSGNQFSFNNGADKVLHMSADGNVGVGARAEANYKLNVYGDMILGHHFNSIGGNEKLSFGGTSNTDALFIQRFNTSENATDLRVNIGDDGGSADRFVVGYSAYPNNNWVTSFIVEAGGRLGIGTDMVTSELSVGWNHGSKLSVGNKNWVSKDIIRTNWTAENGDYVDLLVPGAVANTSFIRLNQAGNVGIGTLAPDAQYKLSVNGRIRAKGLRVQSAGWSDFVFEPDYKLRSLSELEKFIKANKHLPEIPSAKEVMKDGQEVGEIQSKLLQKIEELTLYTIELNKQVKALEDKNKKLENQQQQISTLQQQFDELKKLIGK
jgi:hypothetical protein